MATITREPFLLGISYLDLRRPDGVFAVVCRDDEASLLPIFHPGTTAALAVLLTKSIANRVFDEASFMLENAERQQSLADECGTSYAIAQWSLPGEKVLLIAADTVNLDTAQHALHVCIGDNPTIARYQNLHFHFANCTQPYLSSAARAVWATRQF